jgi:hypothetical protein
LLLKKQAVAIHSGQCYGFGMARKQNDLQALLNLIGETHDLLCTTVLPDERSARASELLTTALHLADYLLEVSPAAELGAKGGKQAAKRGSEYFKKNSRFAQGAQRRQIEK